MSIKHLELETDDPTLNVKDSRFNDDLAICVHNVSKMYPLYAHPSDRLKQSLWYALPEFLRGKSRQFYREFWALRDVSFEVKKGETLGIIGQNGSGKSTLLQIIAGILTPTTGEIQVKGRVAALLELGSGFNPEFTGRENVFMNGVILGVRREEIAEHFDEIAAFANIGQFMDQPVKFYSSGMFVRLAFAVQACLEPDILIVDEALAVGDTAFQMKCINQMKHLSERGVTILLVTHDVQTVRSFCNKAIWLHQGVIKDIGAPLEVTSGYVQSLFIDQTVEQSDITLLLNGQSPAPSTEVNTSPDPQQPIREYRLLSLDARSDLVRWGSGELKIEAVAINNGQHAIREAIFEHGERLWVEFQVRAWGDIVSSNVGFGFAFRNHKGLDIITSTTYEEGHRFAPFQAGEIIQVVFELNNILAAGDYALVVNVEDRTASGCYYYDFVENALLFKVISPKMIYSLVLPPIKQQVRSLNARLTKGEQPIA